MALLLLLLLSAGSSGPPPPPLPPPLETGSRSSSWDSRISPSILLMIAILAIIFFLSGLLHLLIRYLLTPSPSLPPDHRDPSSLDATAMQGQLQQLFHLHDSGVDQAFIDALPVFLYRSLTKDPFDCAVCLCEFDPDDRLRLLPDCSHAFHIHCIDTWLLSHSTCPLCRRSLLLLAPDADADDRLPAADHPDGPRAEDPDKDPPPPPPQGRVVEVKLGKFRAQGGEGCSGAAIDGRRCFSMGSFEYVMDESSQLKVAIRRTPAGGKAGGVDKRRRMAMSECDCHSERELGRKEEGASVSRSWLRGLVGRRAPGDAGSRRVGSFRLGSEVDSGSELGGYDGESGYDGNGAVLRRGEEAPSFARRTMLWVMGRTTHHHSQATNRVGTTTIHFPDV